MAVSEGAKGADLDQKFNAAVLIVQNMPKNGPVNTSNEQKLRFYSLFKQASVGPCNKPRPPFWNIVEKYKWDAWNSLGLMSLQTAKEKYVCELKNIIDSSLATHSFKPWLHEDENGLKRILQPNFEILGYDWGTLCGAASRRRSLYSSDFVANETAANNSIVEKKSIDCYDVGLNRPTTRVGEPDISRTTEIIEEDTVDSHYSSDDDYTDAKDDEQYFQWLRSDPADENSCYAECCANRRKGGDSLTGIPKWLAMQRTALHIVDKRLSTVAAHLNMLLKTLSSQQKMLSLFLSRIAPEMRRISSPLIFIFFIIWPFVVNFLMRYFSLRRR